ncbi:AMP-dependent synthetase and ligase [Myxococcus stipitatus DSM 14675]|uniref:AMP-dependent synthetase and ligase n=1 Tax=Myxococcus stipitatus (strain DSM 14675 / JCM 12634 / Mx s8) TaxID=1278073 RepID=L7UE23_MYXSD|nr:acyl-CoA synthetase [Myxococcus stipitatus]AGC46105.1 AMP-dependent synthetase and ligase [Myxococcus stipitatus DSM 14675]
MQGLNFWELAQRAPSHPAVIGPDGHVTTAGALLRAANQLVHGLRARGLRRGDTLAVVLKNELAMLELFMAAWQAGWYLTPINTHLTAHEIAYILKDCEARAVFCSDRTADVTRKSLALLGRTEQDCFATCEIPGLESYAALKAHQPEDLPPERSAGATMTYTSGTAGQPKGVRRPLSPAPPERVGESFASFLGLFGITPGDGGVHLTTSPLYHTAVLNFCTNHLHFGHTVVLMDKWTPEGTLELIARHRVTTTHMVPTLFHRLLALPEDVKRKADVSSLRQVIHGAAPCSVEVKRAMLGWWGHVIYEYYAATEGGGTLATPEQWLAHPGTVGRAWPMSTLLVLRDDGTPCEPGEVGILYLRMGSHRFEYHKAREKTDSAWRGDFFTVGDAGYLDAEGFLYLCDRKSDFIISGGVNIYPAEIEMALSGHPKVADAAIFGVPDEDWGERIKAVIEPMPGVQPGPELVAELLAFCRERLASFKCPNSFDFTDALPRDPNGKLMKRKLRDPYWQAPPGAKGMPGSLQS